MNPNLTTGAMAALVLTACSPGSDKAKLVDACIEEGRSPATCECFASEIKKRYTPGQFATLAEAAVEGESALDAVLNTVPVEEKLDLIVSFDEAVVACGRDNFR